MLASCSRLKKIDFDPQILVNRIAQIGDVIESIAAHLPDGEELTIAEDDIGMHVSPPILYVFCE